MKNLILILSFFPLIVYGQTGSETEIKMTTEYCSENPELQDILTFENIDYFKVKVTGKELKGKFFSLVVKELWDGQVSKTDTLINTAKKGGLFPIQSDTLAFKVTAKKMNSDKLKVFFRFPQFGNVRLFEATDSYDYSLRDIGTKMDIKIGQEFPAFAYILPYEKDGWKMWCAVDSSGKDVYSWGKEFGIEHYLIFEMKFE
ncbi:hypothetical protein GM418_24070 [Maribellus comscasis]|uniref:Uncharacterized protein n=1 Tax=Maribellus comscasis TaxID=2681766 RepID=A0A6I6K4U6_9BACT|nr:hypothetical protein [Maribellus comscasis]QGY46623.1 hypothetical protein GM418_24070 [Maribellus comscasis]